MLQAHDFAETIAILEKLPGGPRLLSWCGGVPNFGDGEVVSLTLDRRGTSVLRLLAVRRESDGTFKQAIISFDLSDMIDVTIEGFSHQNVVGGLTLRRAPNKATDPSLKGIGLKDPEFEIALAPCAGAFGTIRASITNISIDAV